MLLFLLLLQSLLKLRGRSSFLGCSVCQPSGRSLGILEVLLIGLIILEPKEIYLLVRLGTALGKFFHLDETPFLRGAGTDGSSKTLVPT